MKYENTFYFLIRISNRIYDKNIKYKIDEYLKNNNIKL
jgi:hypothetical protein